MKKLIPVLAVFLVMSIVSIALAGGAPKRQEEAFTQATASVDAVGPIVELRNVPPQTVGYDVICNLAPVIASRVAYAPAIAVTAKSRGLSATVNWRSKFTSPSDYSARSGPKPEPRIQIPSFIKR